MHNSWRTVDFTHNPAEGNHTFALACSPGSSKAHDGNGNLPFALFNKFALSSVKLFGDKTHRFWCPCPPSPPHSHLLTRVRAIRLPDDEAVHEENPGGSIGSRSSTTPPLAGKFASQTCCANHRFCIRSTYSTRCLSPGDCLKSFANLPLYSPECECCFPASHPYRLARAHVGQPPAVYPRWSASRLEI